LTFTISTDKARLDRALIHRFLTSSYWAEGRSREVVDASIEGSLCFGVYQRNAQVGFARVITDYATFAYLADVFVLEAHRRQGLSKRLVGAVLAHPPLQTCGWTLFTKDAHGLYEQFGFERHREPERLMRRKSLAASPLGEES
jgi:GNAT superfamily N-acetyltransferase